MRRFIAVLLAALAAAGAAAADIGGVPVDDKAAVGGQELLLNGGGVRKRVVFKVYVASLYLPQKAADLAACSPKVHAGSGSTCCARCRPTRSSTR